MAKPIPVTNEALQKIFKKSAARLLVLAAEGEDDLLQMIHRKAEASQEAGKDKLEITFTHTIKVDFTKGIQTDKLGGNIKVCLCLEGSLDDPDQEELDFDSGEELNDDC